jgi:hypothetical protein
VTKAANSRITLYNDRIERVKPRAFAFMSKANQDMEVTSIKSVTSVKAEGRLAHEGDRLRER